MNKKDKLIIKICKSVIVVFGVLTVFNVIMLVNKKSYALFQKTVKTDTIIHIQTANEFPSESGIGTDVVKDTVGKDGGIKGVDPDNGKECASIEECPEYRYIGTNVNNYVTFNEEMWRIVGIFTDEETGEEHLKIVRDSILLGDIMPTTYNSNGTAYTIKYNNTNYAYWNYGGSYNNNWATAGLQYWLNGEDEEGYLGKLKTEVKDMIADTTYYLGSVDGMRDTPKTAYQHERDVENCQDNTSTVDNQEGCYVWGGNQVTWEGKVGLLYPSDYGFSADSSNWDKVLYNYGSASSSSWLQSANHSSYNEWLLSPSSYDYGDAVVWSESGSVGIGVVYECNLCGLRPSLNLISEIKIIGGAGTKSNPYQLG